MSDKITSGQSLYFGGRVADIIHKLETDRHKTQQAIDDSDHPVWARIRAILAELLMKDEEAGVPQEVETSSDPIIHLDRSVKLVFPSWVKQVMHPELQDIGPSEFDITQVEQWLHDDQKNNFVAGQVIYDYHKEDDMLMADFGLRELLAIQARGIKFFRKHFKGKYPCAWKSVVQDGNDNLSVPYLNEQDDEVMLRWDWLGLVLYSYSPALRHARPKAQVT